jgi:hypothetical protein
VAVQGFAVRNLCLSLAIVLFSATTAQSGVSAYPSFYHSRGTDYYESLRAAKLAWLKANAAAVAADLVQARATPKGDAKPQTEAMIDRLSKRAGQIDAEIAVMRGPRDTRQENLLKHNVEAWIGAARRGGNGAQALRLMHDLEGTGL